jgi:hypothetical protein
MTAEEIHPQRIAARAAGLGASLCTAVPFRPANWPPFVFQRWLEDGRYDNRSHGSAQVHLARAGITAARLRMEQAQATVTALKAVGRAAAVMAASGRELTANALLERLSSILQYVLPRGG